MNLIESYQTEIALLIKPISSKKTTGINLREDISPSSSYYMLKDLRTRARNIERKTAVGEEGLDALPDWRAILDEGQKVLIKKSKDLEITTWVLEALVRLEGFDGLIKGFLLIEALIDRYWDNLFPLPDEEGYEIRFSPIIGLNGNESEGTLIQPIKEICITDVSQSQGYALWQYQQSIEFSKITDPKVIEKKLEQGIIKLEEITKAAKSAAADFYPILWGKVALCLEVFDRFMAKLNHLCGDQSIPASNIKSTLALFQDHLRFMTKEIGCPLEKKVAETNTAIIQESRAPEKKLDSSVKKELISSRSDALQTLIQVAGFFRETEPHSPIPYLLDRAVRWGHLPFPELLKEMIADESARKNAYEMSGILKEE